MPRVVAFEIVGPHTLRVSFDDGVVQVIDFYPVLAGAMYLPLKDVDYFNQVRIEPDFHTLVWPNDADFNPETLHDWPEHAEWLEQRARRWERESEQQEAGE